MNITIWSIVAGAPLAVCLASAASAQTTAAAVPADTFATAVTEADLGQVTGRDNTAVLAAIATQRNTVSGNSVTGNSVTGSVTIDGNAFQNLQGLAVISANSGNNVAINSAMNVTINLAPQ